MLAACLSAEPPVDGDGRSVRIGSVHVRADTARTTREAATIVRRAAPVLRELFGSDPGSVEVTLVSSPDAPGYAYDSFDQDRNEILLLWDGHDPDYAEWTLVHELAHAFQHALDPAAYEREPSWIHEGWAEHACWRYYAALGRDRADGFLRAQARRRREGGRSFLEVAGDVYAHDWPVTYPACHLAVHVLARDHSEGAVAAYFRDPIRTDLEGGLAAHFGVTPRELDRRIDALVRELVGGD